MRDKPSLTRNINRNRITQKQNNRYPKNAETVRSVLVYNFYGPGQVLWQWDTLDWGLE